MPSEDLPDWLKPLAERLLTMRGEDLSAFVPPEDANPREGAVLVLFGEGPEGPDLLLTERGHDMRSQPAQVSFPGGSMDPGETAVEGALREAHEETGLDPAGVEIIGVLPRIWLPPRNFAVATVIGYWRDPSPVSVVDPIEVHAVFRQPVEKLLDPARRFSVKHPLGWAGPGWMVGPDDDVLLWGFTANIINAIFDFVGWTREWDATDVRGLPDRHLDWPRIAEFLGVEVDDFDSFDPVAAGLVTEEYFDLDRDHKTADEDRG
ncbi:MAG TPA: CoA pyrophosphatase [Nocardioidaceae bacterium]|nr:CoA pyrophosphatase [Nocardioidaceae bacterium]